MNRSDLQPRHGTAVFIASGLLVVLVSAWGLLAPESMRHVSALGLGLTTRNFGWFLLLAVTACLVFCLGLIIGPVGRVRLGQDNERPAYSTIAWWGMIFTSGMGVGLVFWGVAEPLTHFAAPPMDANPARSPEAARQAFVYSFFHWGLHPWGIYAVCGLAMALAQFRHGREGLVSAACAAAWRGMPPRPASAALDILATVATVFGVATTFGLGTLQIGAGLNLVFGWPNQPGLWLAIIAVAALLYISTAVLGIDRGLRRVSNLNIALAFGLMLYVFAVGPTSFMLSTGVTSVGNYLAQALPLGLRLDPFSPADSAAATWSSNWTLFYWAWWIAWTPAVGGFIAQISRGRTVREFLLGVLMLPTLLSFAWFSVFGGAGLHFDLHTVAGGGTGTLSDAARKLAEEGGLATAVQSDVTIAFFKSLSVFPGSIALQVVALALIIFFFVTSANSVTLILAMYTSGGKLDPSAWSKVFWGAAQAALAAALLLSGGKSMLVNFQTASIAAALPFAFVLLLLMWSSVKMLRAPARPAAESRRNDQWRRNTAP